ncbi:unnamed protein product [Citrullus colocynthis]|uniref:Uncharacterized protein n=1 Tax=Citrullus colocynthis TaxID=252529 RepID=A0ABP0YK41_9ROSI
MEYDTSSRWRFQKGAINTDWNFFVTLTPALYEHNEFAPYLIIINLGTREKNDWPQINLQSPLLASLYNLLSHLNKTHFNSLSASSACLSPQLTPILLVVC